MAVSSAIVDHGAVVKNYYLLDAAVASEAYGPTDPHPDMLHPQWAGYDPALYASEWYILFQSDNPMDSRSKLTWRDRFANRPAGTTFYNFYSSGEEVLNVHTGEPGIFDIGLFQQSGQYAWALQEKLKGRLPFGILLGSNYGGWGFGLDDHYTEINDPNVGDPMAVPSVKIPLKPSETVSLLQYPSILRTQPFFIKGANDAALFTEVGGSQFAYNNKARLLAEAIPARSLAAGKKSVAAFDTFNIDMQNELKTLLNKWPEDRKPNNWRHTDFRAVAYLYTCNLYKQFILNGGLK